MGGRSDVGTARSRTCGGTHRGYLSCNHMDRVKEAFPLPWWWDSTLCRSSGMASCTDGPDLVGRTDRCAAWFAASELGPYLIAGETPVCCLETEAGLGLMEWIQASRRW